MIPIVGVSLEEALLGFGGDDSAELHDKEVEIETSDVKGSQTAIFVYNPANEDPSGTPPGPWDGYSLFTVDLSGVKEDIADLEEQITNAETCRQQVIAILQQYDPDYSPEEGECPASKVEDLYDDWVADEEEIADLQEQLDDCHDCKDEVVAAIQQYDPNYDPAPGECPAPKIPEIVEDNKGYTFPPDDPDNPDPDRYDKIADLIGNDNLTDENLHIVIKAMDLRYPDVPQGQHNVFYGFYDSVTGAFIDRTSAHQSGIDPVHTDYVTNFRITDPTTGEYTFDWVYWTYLYNPPIWGWATATYTETCRDLIGYGDPTHTYRVSNS